MIETGEYETYAAANGHRMTGMVITNDDGTNRRIRQWDAECADNCPACAEGDPLPDW